MDNNNSIDSLYSEPTWFFIPSRFVWDNWEDFFNDNTTDTLTF